MVTGNRGRYYSPGDQNQNRDNGAKEQRRSNNLYGRGGPFDKRRFRENNSAPPRYRGSGIDPRQRANPPGGRNDWRKHGNDATGDRGFYKEKNEPMIVDGGHGERRSRMQESGSGRVDRAPGDNREMKYYNMRRDEGMGNRADGRSNKDTADDEEGWGPKRRQRGYVPNGKIEKRQRIDEFELKNEPYCDVCDIWFRNVSEKIAHIRAKSHNDMVYVQREKRLEKQLSEIQKRGPSSERVQSQSQMPTQGAPLAPLDPETSMDTGSIVAQNVNNSGGDSCNIIDPDVQKMLFDDVRLIGSIAVPSSFKSWGHKSLKAAEERAKTNKDPQLVHLVKKEITYELIRHSKASTLHRVNWGRAPFATGQSVKVRGNLLPTLSLTQIRSMDERAKPEKKEDNIPISDDDAMEVDEKPTGEPSAHTQPTLASFAGDRHWVRGSNLELNAHLSGEGSVIASEQCVPSCSTDVANAPEISAGPAPSAAPSSSFGDDSFVQQGKQFMPRRPRLCRSERARALVNGFASVSPNLVCNKHFELTQGRVETNKVDDTWLLQKFHDIFDEVTSGEYEYDPVWSELDKIISQLESSGVHRRTVRKCLKLQIDLAIDNRDVKNAVTPARKLMKIIEECNCINETHTDTYIAHWFLLLLFKETLMVRTAVRVNRPSPSRLLAMALRQVPKHSLRSSKVFDMKDIFSALLTNNWVRFFQYARVLEEKSAGICAAYADFVRERALMTMLRVNGHNENVYNLPPYVPLNIVIYTLGFSDVKNCAYVEGEDEELEATRNFMKSLPQNIEIINGEDGRFALLKAGSERAAVRDNGVVHVELLLDKMGATMSLIKSV